MCLLNILLFVLNSKTRTPWWWSRCSTCEPVDSSILSDAFRHGSHPLGYYSRGERRFFSLPALLMLVKVHTRRTSANCPVE